MAIYRHSGLDIVTQSIHQYWCSLVWVFHPSQLGLRGCGVAYRQPVRQYDCPSGILLHLDTFPVVLTLSCHLDKLCPGERKSRYRFSCLTELDITEQCADPAIIRATTSCTGWPCDIIGDTWFKIRVYFARKCKLPCCQEYTWPQEWARRRRFCISKKHYLALPNVTSRETDAVLRWADLVSSQEWRDGNWSERGILTMADETKFRTQKVTWSVMEEHLAALAYSEKKPLVFLAARICMEALAKNKAMYTYSQQYWGFARICTDLLKSRHLEVQEGMLLSLQLYLRTLKIFHSCFSHKCTEYASAGLFPVLLDLLDKCSPDIQAVVVNIIILMAMHAPYISLIANMGGLSSLVKLTATEHQLLRRRVHACLEIVSKHAPSQAKLLEEGILPLAVRNLTLPTPAPIQLNSLFILNSLCNNGKTLVAALAVDNYSVVKAAMRMLTDWTLHISPTNSNSKSQNVSIAQIQNWCTLPRQNLILVCKLCVDDSACRQMVKRGLVLRLKGIWYTCDTDSDRTLVMEALAIMSRFSRPAEKICREGFLSVFTDAIHEKQHREQVLEIISNLGKKHLPEMLETGLVQQLIVCFGDKVFVRRLHPMVLSTLASFCTNDKVRDLLLQNEGKAYTLILDTAFLTNDFSLLQSCIAILSKLNTTVVPLHMLKLNTLLLVAYIDKLLKTGPDGLVLHGLMQLQDYLKVDFLYKAFREHHIQRVVEILCNPPYKPPVQYMAGRVLEVLSGVRSRRSSIRDDTEEDEDSKTKDGKMKKRSSDSFRAQDLESVSERLAELGDGENVFDDEDDDAEEKKGLMGPVVDVDAAVQVNIIDATDEDDDDDSDKENNNEDDEFEIISVGDQEYTVV